MNWLTLVAQAEQAVEAGTVPQLISAVAASITAVTAVLAASFAFQQVKLARRLRLEQAQPYVAVYMESSAVSPHFVDLVIKNYGTTAARNVTLSVSPKPMRSGNAGESAEAVALPSRIPTLVPAQEWRTLWDFSPSRNEQSLPEKHTAVVTCDGVLKVQELKFEYDLDWAFFTGRRWVQAYGVHDAAKALREIEKHVSGWREGSGRGIGVFVRDGDKRDKEEQQRIAEMILERERRQTRGDLDN